ncbi:hypothetical protein JOQ06_010618 [Pogonophryne albipinna]|uniref:Uncharacterized protein n=1 Tax=Pogonophryne albipinna TaxID=1090488 RepID=A0AAD6AW57_9TELE|nr:hypothetical protein JOQ06_010618 [Pogonophryne albipinna]
MRGRTAEELWNQIRVGDMSKKKIVTPCTDPGARSRFTCPLPASLQLLTLGWGTAEERVREGLGEEGDREGVGVVGEAEEEGDVAMGVEGEDLLLGRGKEEARCSRRRRRWRRVEERSRASALRPEADRLARRALAWLVEPFRGAAPPGGASSGQG